MYILFYYEYFTYIMNELFCILSPIIVNNSLLFIVVLNHIILYKYAPSIDLFLHRVYAWLVFR